LEKFWPVPGWTQEDLSSLNKSKFNSIGGQTSGKAMSIKRPQLVDDEIYHIVLRGVGDSEIFRNKDDYWRAIFSLYEFNTTKPVEIRIQREKRKKYGGQTSDDTTTTTTVEFIEKPFIDLVPSGIKEGETLIVKGQALPRTKVIVEVLRGGRFAAIVGDMSQIAGKFEGLADENGRWEIETTNLPSGEF
jgi:hypothetical protein